MRKKIRDVFDVWESQYFWTKLYELTGFDELEPTDMSIKYALHSAEKLISPLLEHITDVDRIADIIYHHYKTNWKHLHDLLSLEYDPIANYDRKESITDTEKHTGTIEDAGEYGKGTIITRTPNLERIEDTERTPNLTKTGTDTRTPNITVTDEENETFKPTTSDSVAVTGQDEDTRSQASFGSTLGDVYKDVHKKGTTTKTTKSGTDTTTTTGTHKETGMEQRDISETESGTENTVRTETESGTDKTEYSGKDTDTTTKTFNDTIEKTHTGSLSGNIGVTTTQQMMQSEIELWTTYNFCEKVMEDIDKLLTLRVY